MVNDTTTLNGALSQLGETMAANLTTQGVSSSANEGLTTLAGKILDIEGGGGGGGETIIYQHSMTSDDSYWVTSGGNRTITYSSDGCTVLGTATSDGFYKLDESKVTIPSEFKCEFEITGATEGAYSESTDFVVGNISIRKQSNKLYVSQLSGGSTYNGTFPSTPVSIKVEFGSTVSVYVNGTLLGQTWTGDYQYIGYKTYNQRSMTVKNIKVYTGEGGGGSDCSEYTTQINNAITYINGSGS